MASGYNRSCVVFLRGCKEEITRPEILKIFNKVGQVTRLYIPPHHQFIKIYFATPEEAEFVVNNFKPLDLNWQLNYYPSKEEEMETEEDLNNLEVSSAYVDIHGRSLDVLESETGEIYVPLRNIRHAGYAIFRKDNFDTTLVNKEQILKEFHLNMLSEAKKYLLRNNVRCIDETNIIETIKKCEQMLLGDKTEKVQMKSPLSSDRIVNKKDNNIVVTSNVKPQNLWNTNSTSPATQKAMRPPNINQSPKISTNGDKLKPKSETPPKRTNLMAAGSNVQTNLKVNKVTNQPVPVIEKRSSDLVVRPKPVEVAPLARSKPVEVAPLSTKDDSDTDSSSRNTRFILSDFIAQEEVELRKPVEIVVQVLEKHKFGWAVLTSKASVQETMLVKINENSVNMPIVNNPKKGSIYIAEFEAIWSRVLVRTVNPLRVHFIDYGNTAAVDLVRQLPSEFSQVPAQAFRFRQCDQDNTSVEADKKYTIIAKNKYDDGTYLISTTSKPIFPPQRPKPRVSTARDDFSAEKFTAETVEKKIEPREYLNPINPKTSLQEGEKVMLIGYDNEALYLRNKEGNEGYKEISDYIRGLDKSDLAVSKIQKGQLILCAKDGSPSLHRAHVVDIDGALAKIKYVDEIGDEQLAIKSLRNVDEFLANFPSSVIKAPQLKNISTYLKNNDVVAFIDKLQEERLKLKVNLSDGFDLEMPDKTLLSKVCDNMINKASTPEEEKVVELKPATPSPPPKETVAPKRLPPKRKKKAVQYEAMDYVKPEVGEEANFLCYSFESLNQITLLSLGEKEVEWYTQIIDINVESNEPYHPEMYDMCLGKFTDEDGTATWYRGVVMNEEDGKYQIMFVDYGNTVWLKPEDLRVYPEDLKDIPILGIICELTGIPKTKDIYNRLKDELTDGETVSVKIKGVDNDNQYQIEIPKLYDKLKAEGLI